MKLKWTNILIVSVLLAIVSTAIVLDIRIQQLGDELKRPFCKYIVQLDYVEHIGDSTNRLQTDILPEHYFDRSLAEKDSSDRMRESEQLRRELEDNYELIIKIIKDCN